MHRTRWWFVALGALVWALPACRDTAAPDSPRAPIDPALTTVTTEPTEVVVVFDEALTDGDALAAAIQRLGAGAIGFAHLPLVAALATGDQIQAMAGLPGVLGVYPNTPMKPLNAQVVGSVRADSVHALGITGKGIGIAILDTGIDGTHPDLAFGSKTVQNVRMIGDTKDLYTFPGRDSLTGLKTPKAVRRPRR